MMQKQKDIYREKPDAVLNIDGCTVRVWHPILSQEERERRMRRIAEAAAKLLIAEEWNRAEAQAG